MICWCEWVRNHKKPEQCKGGWTFHKFDSKRATIFFLKNLPPQLRSIATPLPQLENFMVSFGKQLPKRNRRNLIITSKLFLLDSHASLNSHWWKVLFSRITSEISYSKKMYQKNWTSIPAYLKFFIFKSSPNFSGSPAFLKLIYPSVNESLTQYFDKQDDLFKL